MKNILWYMRGFNIMFWGDLIWYMRVRVGVRGFNIQNLLCFSY
jgi:hypothetical protein